MNTAIAGYIETQVNIPTDIPQDSFVSVERKPPPQIYGIGFQPAKTIPEIPRWFLEKYSSRDWKILDPFAGSGTMVMEAILSGAWPFWTDYHPLAQLICRVKTTQHDLLSLRASYFGILDRAIGRSSEVLETVHFANKRFWFQEPVCEALELLKDEIALSQPDARDFLQLVLASTARRVSNMNSAMILAARRAHVQEIPTRTRSTVYQAFSSYAAQTLLALHEWQALCEGSQARAVKIPQDDARDLHSCESYDAIVTSPPYVNAIDYVWASKFEVHWLGYLTSDSERLALYSKEIGTERIPTSECERVGQTGHEHLDTLIRDIYSGKMYQATPRQNHLRARVVWQYFRDMRAHLAAAHSVLKPRGLYCFAVGDSCRICGVQVPVASLLTDFAEQIGFSKVFRFNVLLKNRRLNVPRNVAWADTIKHDTIVVLERR